MLEINYNQINFSLVVDLPDFYKSKLPEIVKVRSLIDSCKLLFKLPGDRVILEVSESDRIYKITLQNPDIKRTLLGVIVYLPLQNRLDLFLPDNLEIPLIQWKNKQVVHKNYSMLLDRAGMDKLFSRLVNVI